MLRINTCKLGVSGWGGVRSGNQCRFRGRVPSLLARVDFARHIPSLASAFSFLLGFFRVLSGSFGFYGSNEHLVSTNHVIVDSLLQFIKKPADVCVILGIIEVSQWHRLPTQRLQLFLDIFKSAGGFKHPV